MPSDPFQLMKGETAHLTACAYPGCRNGMMFHVGPVCHEHALLIAEAVNRSQAKPITEAHAAAALRRQRDDERARQLAESRGTQPGWIYYVRIGDRVKIGYSTDVKRRMGEYPPESRLLAVHPGTRKLETEMHQRFAGSRAAGREWFRETVEITEHIAQVLDQFGEPTGHRYTFRTDRTPLRSRPA